MDIINSQHVKVNLSKIRLIKNVFEIYRHVNLMTLRFYNPTMWLYEKGEDKRKKICFQENMFAE